MHVQHFRENMDHSLEWMIFWICIYNKIIATAEQKSIKSFFLV